MNTTKLIELLKTIEKGSSGRSREISFNIKRKKTTHIFEPEIKVCSTGDGICGAEVCLEIIPNE